jgi:hypothetical protein
MGWDELEHADDGNVVRKGLFVQILTFLEYLRIDTAGFGAAAAGDVAGNINIFALLLARRAGIRRGLCRYCVAAFIAFPDSHFLPPKHSCS